MNLAQRISLWLIMTVGAGALMLSLSQEHPKVKVMVPKVELGATTVEELREDYALYNSGWFAGDLPETTTILFQDPPVEVWGKDPLPIGLTVQFTDDNFVIWITPKWNYSLSAARMTLLHEQCHIDTWDEVDKEHIDHGPKWQRCMLNLAEHGAFNGIW